MRKSLLGGAIKTGTIARASLLAQLRGGHSAEAFIVQLLSALSNVHPTKSHHRFEGFATLELFAKELVKYVVWRATSHRKKSVAPYWHEGRNVVAMQRDSEEVREFDHDAL